MSHRADYPMEAICLRAIQGWLCDGWGEEFNNLGNILSHGVQDDGNSCGVALINTLEHALYTDTEIFQHRHRRMHRMQLFVHLGGAQLRAVQWHDYKRKPCLLYLQSPRASSRRPEIATSHISTGDELALNDFNFPDMSDWVLTDSAPLPSTPPPLPSAPRTPPPLLLPAPLTPLLPLLSAPHTPPLPPSSPSAPCTSPLPPSSAPCSPLLPLDTLPLPQSSVLHTLPGSTASRPDVLASDLSSPPTIRRDTSSSQLPPVPRKKLSKIVPENQLQSGLFKFFRKLTPAEAEQQRVEQAEHARMLYEKDAADAAHTQRIAEADKVAHRRELERVRQANKRARDKEARNQQEKEDAKVCLLLIFAMDAHILLQVSITDVLIPANNLIASGDPRIAELSRPRRDFKEEQRLERKTSLHTGRKRKREATDATLVNWTSPMLWSQIEAAAREAGPSMSPTEIVRLLKARNPKDFARLTTQVLGSYIQRPANLNERPRWKDSVIRRVGYRPGGHTTRSGMLVCGDTASANEVADIPC
jgi:hypothetical protein